MDIITNQNEVYELETEWVTLRSEPLRNSEKSLLSIPNKRIKKIETQDEIGDEEQ